ncbi:MAG: energy transducer TonB [Pyrinomonadaceae bacterium]
MFDKLIESASDAADLRGRRKYFAVSTAVVGLLFAAAVVVSIYAADISLGTDEFELSAMLAPVEPPAAAPEPSRPRRQDRSPQERTELPRRQANIMRPDEQPIDIPPISTERPTQMSRPDGRFIIDPNAREIAGPPSFDSDRGAATTSSSSGSDVAPERDDTAGTARPVVEPPPPPRPPVTKTLGVINGRAKLLPVPTYPPGAVALNLQGKVSVQVAIDEEGVVTSAKAVDGHPMFRKVAEDAARRARFDPTLLSKVPVKVTGVIVYNFTRN